jgi:hypothetical protein
MLFSVTYHAIRYWTLLAVEYAYAEQEQRWLEQQDGAFSWRLRAEQAKVRLQKEIERNGK